jgi:glycosyltransferase involved in cell wall biosynthesis
MRILIINQPFWPDVVATAQHMSDWADHLASRGHTVTVIASRSVYGTQGAVLPKSEIHHGIHIHRVGSNLFRKGRILTRLVDFALFHLRALWKTLTLPKQDVVVCLTTPPFIGIVGMIAKSLRGSHYIQYEMDLYPDVSIVLGVLPPHSLSAKILERLHRRLLRSADRVVVLGRCMARLIESKGIPLEKLLLVTPWADPDAVRPIPRDQNPFRKLHNLQNQKVIMYSGNLGLAHDTDTLLALIEHYKDDPALRFVFIGGGKKMDQLRRIAAEKKLTNLLMLDYVPRENLSDMLSAADLHLITQAAGTAGIIVPSKLYGILAAGRPSLYIGPPDTEIAYQLRESMAGVVVAVGDSQGAIRALDKALQTSTALTETRSREALHGHTRAECVAKLTDMVESLAKTITNLTN